MPRLIDVDALIVEHCKGCSKDIQDGCKTDPVCATLMWFEDAPTIDAVPVVRCKDCANCVAHRKRNGEVCFYRCNFHDIEVEPDDFCSYGERRGDTNG